MASEQNVGVDDAWFIGEDKELVITCYTSQAYTTAQDITGWSLSYMLKRHKRDADADALVTKTTGGGIALTTPASGVCTVSIADTDTDGLDEDSYHHELKRTGAGTEAVLMYGGVYLRRGVHRT